MVYVRKNIIHDVTWNKIGTTPILLVNVQKNNAKIKICAVYRSPQTKIISFVQNLEAFLENFVNKENVDYVIVGDINIDISRPTINALNYLNTVAF